MREVVLVLNAGSSSLKFAVYSADGAEGLLHGSVSGIGGADVRFSLDAMPSSDVSDLPALAPGSAHAECLRELLRWLGRGDGTGFHVLAVGHRVVHGGERYAAPVRLTPEILGDLKALIPLAPLHQPHNLAAVEAVWALYPQAVQVACFDTAFHASAPWQATALALPRIWRERGVRRYGFHGLSYESIAGRLARFWPDLAAGRVVVAHLGSGSSLCAMMGGRSVETTMGFSALDGLMMGTRCGALDPGVVLYLIQSAGLSADQVSDLLYRQSGLLGVSGISSDMRALLADESAPAREAVELFVYRVVREIWALAGVMGGLDGVVFTAGIGEHAPEVRARVLDGLAGLGCRIDPVANLANAERISKVSSALTALVLPTDEERVIVGHTLRVAQAAA